MTAIGTIIGDYKITGQPQDIDGCTFTPAKRLSDNQNGELTNEHCIFDDLPNEVVGYETTPFIISNGDGTYQPIPAHLPKPQYDDICIGVTKDGKTITLIMGGRYGDTGMYSHNWVENGTNYPINRENGDRTLGYSGTVFSCPEGRGGTYAGYHSNHGYIINP